MTTGAAGSNAAATITGTAPNQTLSLTIPRGNTGETGATGAAGPANSLSIGTVTTGAAGSSASATITGTAPSQTLNLVIPRGDAGTGGMSWASVPDAPGSTGTAGAMAYDASNIYVCVASNTWRRAALSSWTATDPQFASVSLLLHLDGTDNSTTFTDSSGTPKTFTASGNARIRTVQSRFGGASLYLDGGGYISTPSHSGFAFGTGDFTVEMWVYRLSGNTWHGLFVSGNNETSQLSLRISNSNKLEFFFNNNAATSTTSNVPSGEWAHVAVSRSSGTTRLFVNGVQGASVADSSNYSGSGNACIGARLVDGSADLFMFGYIDEFRVTKGVARYTANFTPPTAPFPDA